MEIVDIKNLPPVAEVTKKKVDAKLITKNVGEGEEKKLFIVRVEMVENEESGKDLLVQQGEGSVLHFNVFANEEQEEREATLETEGSDEKNN